VLALLRANWLNLRRDYIALGLTFILPLLFFSIFAVIFGRLGPGSGQRIQPLSVIVVDQDGSAAARRFMEVLGAQQALQVVSVLPAPGGGTRPATEELARERIRAGAYPAAVILPPGFGSSLESFRLPPVDILYDAANPVARYVVGGLLQGAAVRTERELLAAGRRPPQASALSAEQRDLLLGLLSVPAPAASGNAAATTGGTAAPTAGAGIEGPLPLRFRDVRGQRVNMVSYYAAGIAVMFLLFSMAGAGGSLLEDQEIGTLERLLNADVDMGLILFADWVFFAVVGMAQVAVMFVWGALVFGLDLWSASRLAGFGVMTVCTAAAAAGFGIVLATLCRTRSQLAGISTILILVMSALGGSMVPRFVMPAFFEYAGRFTFNGWALDGYLKVFWNDNPDAGVGQALVVLWPQVAVLVGMTLVFLLSARLLARRWECV